MPTPNIFRPVIRNSLIFLFGLSQHSCYSVFLFLNQNICCGFSKEQSQNICLDWWVKKYLTLYAQKFYFSGHMLPKKKKKIYIFYTMLSPVHLTSPPGTATKQCWWCPQIDRNCYNKGRSRGGEGGPGGTGGQEPPPPPPPMKNHKIYWFLLGTSNWTPPSPPWKSWTPSALKKMLHPHWNLGKL